MICGSLCFLIRFLQLFHGYFYDLAVFSEVAVIFPTVLAELSNNNNIIDNKQLHFSFQSSLILLPLQIRYILDCLQLTPQVLSSK
jgi:hypothetical protein